MVTQYEEYCDWFAIYGDQRRDDADYELAACYDRYDGWRNEINLEGETYVPEIDDVPPPSPQNLGGGETSLPTRSDERDESLPF